MAALPETHLVWEERCREPVGPRPQRESIERSKGDRPAAFGSRPERSSCRRRDGEPTLRYAESKML